MRRLPLLAFLAACGRSTITLEAGPTPCLAVEYHATVQPVAGVAQTTVDWSGLTSDLYGAPFTPAEVAEVSLWAFGGLTCDDLIWQINCGSFTQADLIGAAAFDPAGASQASLDAFTVSGTDSLEDPACGPGACCLLDLCDASGAIRAMVPASLDEALEAATILVDPTQAGLAAITSGEGAPPGLPAPRGPETTLDWADWLEGAGTAGSCGMCPGGGLLDAGDIHLVRLARYGPEVGDPLLDLVAPAGGRAAEVYEAMPEGATSLDLATLVDDAGRRFPGFGGAGTWWLGLLGEGPVFYRPHYLGWVDAD